LFKLLLQYVNQLIQSTSGIGLYDQVIADIEKQKETVLPVYDGFSKKINDQKYLGSLSIPEQHALGQNEINYKKLLRGMDEGISILLKQKWTHNIRMVLWYLEDVKILIEDVLSGNYELSEIGKDVKAKLLIPEKRFAKADYLGRISIVQITIDTLRDEVINEADWGHCENVDLFKWSIITGLGKAHRVLQIELEDTEANGLPDPHKFDIPEIVVPEVPESPEDVKEPVLEEYPI